MFRNEKVEKIKEQLEKLSTKKGEIEKVISDMEEALNQTVELYATGKVGVKDIEEANGFLKERHQELADVERMIERVESVKNKVQVESIPLVKVARQKKIDAIDKEWETKNKELKRKQAEVLLCLNDLSKIRHKAKSITKGYVELMNELDPEGNHKKFAGKSLAFREYEELPLNPNHAYFGENKALEMSFSIPEWAVKKALAGNLPQWVRDIEKKLNSK